MAFNDWESLSMKERALYIRLAVANGLHTVDDIRNSYKEGGYIYERLPLLLREAGLNVKVTSGLRGPRYKGDKSHHIHHGAVDIVPLGKTTFEDIEKVVYSNPTIYNYMLDNGLGILDETGRTLASRDTMKKTRATGAHFHFGKDKVPAKMFADRMSSLWDNKMERLNNSITLPPTMATPTFRELSLYNPYTFNSPLLDSNEGNVPNNILIVKELPIQKLSSNIIVEEEPLVNPLDIIASVLDTVPSITTYNTPRPLTATEILALREAERNTLLAKEFESSLLRDNLLGIEEDSNLFQGGGYTQLKDIEKQVLLKLKDFEERLSKPTMIGYDKDRAFTLSNAGSLTGAHLSEEMADYIILEAAKAGVDLLTAFGIAAAESTLGNPTDDKSSWNISSGIRRSFNNVYPGTELHINSGGDAVNELELFNFYYPLEDLNPYTQLLNAARRRANNGEDYFKALAEGMSYADKLALKPISTSSITQLAMEYYKKHGEGYNPNYKKATGKSYVQHVLKKGKEALQSPEMLLAIANYALRKLLSSETNIYFAPWNKHSLGGNMFGGGGNKGRYWVDDDNMLPELIVTPKGNSIVRDEAGNSALTVGAIRDINPNATIYERVNRELKDNQYNTELPQWIVNMNADRYANAVSPGIGDLVTAGLKPLDAMMPSRWVGLLDSDNNKGLVHLFDKDNRGFFIGDDPTKPFSKRYAEEHPLWATAGNLVGDVLIGVAGKKTLDSAKDLTKSLYHSLIREPIPFSEKQAAAQRMEDLIHSADYIQKQKSAGLTDTLIKDFQDMVSRRLNNGNFPAYYKRMKDRGESVVLPKPIGGVYMRRGLSPEDFINAFDHEVAHYSTVNFEKPGSFFNKIAGLVNRENPEAVEKMMDYNSSVAPLRPKSDALTIRKDRGLETDVDWLNKSENKRLLDYYQNELEIRSNAYAILQDAERRGMSIDEYVDFCTSPGGEIYGASPKPIKYLNYAFTPDNMKKFLKGFLSISTPITLTTNIDNDK